MKVIVQVVVDSDDGTPAVIREVFGFEPAPLAPDSLGLKLAQAKDVLAAVQAATVDEQARTALAARSGCPHCGTARRHKGVHTIVVRTLFGTLRLASPRWHHCRCRPQPTGTFSPLAGVLPERATPELAYLEAKFAGLMSYGLSAKVLAEVLPLGRVLHPSEVRRRTHAVAQRLDDELGPEQPQFIENAENGTAGDGTADSGTADSGPGESCPAENDPAESGPLIVGLDGGYVHRAHRRSRRGRSFEVIAGKSAAAHGSSKCFGFVQTYDPKPRRRVSEVLRSQGVHAGQPVTFLTDGAVDVRHLPRHLDPEAVHILDWFHVAMRFTVMDQMAKSVRNAGQIGLAAAVAEKLERLKWLLWHGNVARALKVVGDLGSDLDVDDDPSAEHTKLLKEVRKFGDYINERRVDPRLRATAPGRRGHLHRVRRVDREPGHQQTHGEKATDEMDTGRSAPAHPGPHPGSQRRTRRRLPPLVPRLHPHRRTPRHRRIASPGLLHSRLQGWQARRWGDEGDRGDRRDGHPTTGGHP